MWEQMQRQQQRLQHTSASPAIKGTATKQQRVQHLRTVTVETHHQELHHQKQNGELSHGRKNSSATLSNGLPPLHALMADISCGNWGVLLGKSGSSSGSEAGGFSAYNRNIPMGRPSQIVPPTPPPPANPSYFAGGGVGPYPMSAGRDPYMGGAPPQPFMTFSSAEPMMDRTYPYMGKKGYGMGGAYPGFTGMEGYHYGGSAYPPYHYMGQGMHGLGGYPNAGPGYMNNVFAHSYNVGNTGHHVGAPDISLGGARPKARGNWGLWHVPYPPADYREPHQGLGRGRRSYDRRFVRERQKEREMRRPNQAFFNSTFDMDDDEIESISVV